jgi:hypothetical protein
MPLLDKIISGGQTGADRAALDWAIGHGIAHGGWCPRGRLAEDGPIDPLYQLVETPSGDYSERTEWNVRDSDGTVVFSTRLELFGGSKDTVASARKHRRPIIHISREGTEDPADALREFIRASDVRILNVAGPRQSEEPGIGEYVETTLNQALEN